MLAGSETSMNSRYIQVKQEVSAIQGTFSQKPLKLESNVKVETSKANNDRQSCSIPNKKVSEMSSRREPMSTRRSLRARPEVKQELTPLTLESEKGNPSVNSSCTLSDRELIRRVITSNPHYSIKCKEQLQAHVKVTLQRVDPPIPKSESDHIPSPTHNTRSCKLSVSLDTSAKPNQTRKRKCHSEIRKPDTSPALVKRATSRTTHHEKTAEDISALHGLRSQRLDGSKHSYRTDESPGAQREKRRCTDDVRKTGNPSSSAANPKHSATTSNTHAAKQTKTRHGATPQSSDANTKCSENNYKTRSSAGSKPDSVSKRTRNSLPK